jgi:NAD+ kinase
MDLQRIGVLAHPYRPNTAPLAEQTATSLRARGLDVWVRTAWDPVSVRSLVAQSDLIVAIGGDGAMLRTARLCAPLGVPILGMNAGRLGFLTEVMPDKWGVAEERLLNGDFWIEDRMMIRCEIWDTHANECRETEDALNDIVIGRGALARSVYLDAYVDDIWTTTYNADAVIISTSTGSTAYALAVGGPLMPPKLRSILMLPVAPHLSMDRSIVVADEDTIKIVVAPRSFDPEVVVTIDGELVASMNVNDYIIVKASDKVSSFVRMRERGYFFRSILDRLEPRLANRHPTDENENGRNTSNE